MPDLTFLRYLARKRQIGAVVLMLTASFVTSQVITAVPTPTTGPPYLQFGIGIAYGMILMWAVLGLAEDAEQVAAEVSDS